MPIVTSTYKSPFITKNDHIGTILPFLASAYYTRSYERERINTPDNDFLDLDWSNRDGKNLAVLCHGLEGSSQNHTVKMTGRAFNKRGWDVCAYNFRGCSGEPNRSIRAYHSAATDDLETVINHILATKTYQSIVLVGFSMGGNLVSKYGGEQGKNIPTAIKKIISVGTPCDLPSCVVELSKKHNKIYFKRFIKSLFEKIRLKKDLLETAGIDVAAILNAKSFYDFDNTYTAPAHGFKDAMDYYVRASALPGIPNIAVPNLMINAQNDTFLGVDCYPIELAKNSPLFYFEMPKHGSHVGFFSLSTDREYWLQKRIIEFAID